MLHALKEYAEKRNMVSLPGFKERSAKYIINLDSNGKYISLSMAEGEGSKGKAFPMCPTLEQSELVSAKTSHFMLDTVSVVLNIPKKPDDTDEIAKAEEKHREFKKLMSMAASHDRFISKCLSALENPEIFNAIQVDAIRQKLKLTNNITFRVGLVYPVENNAWHAWWNEFRKSIKERKQQTETDEMLCFLSGEPVQPEATHGKIGGLSIVGGQPSGSTLVSFDKEAFESYGLEQSTNAAMGAQAVSTYVKVLDTLIQKAPRPLAGIMFLHWYKEAIPDEDDCFMELYSSEGKAEEKAADRLVEAVYSADREGKRDAISGNKYYILLVSASGGRVMIRDYMEGDYTELYNKVNSWFEDNRLVDPTGGGLTRNQKMFTILCRLLPFRSSESIKDLLSRIDKELPSISHSILQSIIKSTPLPECVAARALNYIRSKMQQSDDEEGKQFANLDHIACGLLKAWYNRRINNISKEGVHKMSNELDTRNMSPAYLAGRMMAVLAEIQRKANEGKELNAGIIDRYYTSASNSPSLVIGRLVGLAQHHLANIKNRYEAERFEKILSKISVDLSVDKLPKTLSLEGKTEFALGFYYQKAFMYKESQSDKNVLEKQIDITIKP